MPTFLVRFVLTALIKNIIQFNLFYYLFYFILCHLMNLNKIAFSIISYFCFDNVNRDIVQKKF